MKLFNSVLLSALVLTSCAHSGPVGQSSRKPSSEDYGRVICELVSPSGAKDKFEMKLEPWTDEKMGAGMDDGARGIALRQGFQLEYKTAAGSVECEDCRTGATRLFYSNLTLSKNGKSVEDDGAGFLAEVAISDAKFKDVKSVSCAPVKNSGSMARERRSIASSESHSTSNERIIHGPQLTSTGQISPFIIASSDAGSLSVSVNTTDVLRQMGLFEKLGSSRAKEKISEISKALESQKATVTKASASEYDYGIRAEFKGTCRTMACDDNYKIEVSRRFIGNGSDYELTVRIGQNIDGCATS